MLTTMLSGCSLFHKEHTLGNKPLFVPEHAGYAIDEGKRKITIFNLDNNEIVGDVNYMYKDEWMAEGDFYVDNEGKIYITIQNTGINSVGHTVRIIDPFTGLEEKEIDVNTCPDKIFDLGNNKILVTSNMVLYGDSVIRNVLIDTKSEQIIGHLYTKGLIDVAQKCENDSFELMIAGLSSLGLKENVFISFYCPEKDTEISDYSREIQFNHNDEWPYNSFIKSKGYYYISMGSDISLYNSTTLKREKTIAIFSNGNGIGKMIKVNNKIYFVRCLNDFSGNDVDSVIVIDDNTHEIIKSIKIPYGGPIDVKYSSLKNRLYVTNRFGGRIVVIDPGTDTVIDTIITEEKDDGFEKLILKE